MGIVYKFMYYEQETLVIRVQLHKFNLSLERAQIIRCAIRCILTVLQMHDNLMYKVRCVLIVHSSDVVATFLTATLSYTI